MTLSHHPARSYSSPKLVSSSPTASAPASVKISHVQLRDLIVCPAERGVLWYVSENTIIEQDILSNTPTRQRTLATLSFTPVTLSTLRLPSSHPSGKDIILLAAGGQEAELFLAMYTYTPRRTRHDNFPKRSPSRNSPLYGLDHPEAVHMDEDNIVQDVKEEDVDEEETAGYSKSWWQHISSLVGSINNSVLLYMPTAPPDDGSGEGERNKPLLPRLVVSNNDCTVKFFDVSLTKRGLRRSTSHRPSLQPMDSRFRRSDPGLRGVCEGEGWNEKGDQRIVRYERVGCLRLPVPVNHTSISPDGSTVLSCGDASTVYLHRILPVRDGTSLLFEPLATYNVPTLAPLPPPPSDSHTRSYLPRSLSHRRYHDAGTYLPYAFVNGSWVLAGPHPFHGDVSGMEIPPACFTTAWSADGMRFAVASQEGAVRVWDVRSKEPLLGAKWETGPRGGVGGGEDGAGGMNIDTQRALYEFTGGAPPWGVRSLKFARSPSGKEFLVFTEHVSRVHVIDADTFSTHDILHIPHIQPSVSGPPIRDDSQLPFPPRSEAVYLPRWTTLGPTDNLPETIRITVRRSHVADSSTGSSEIPAASATQPRSTLGASESEVNDDVEAMLRRARADLRTQTHSLASRRRRGGLMPPEVRASGAEASRRADLGIDRVLSPNVPFTRSPESGSLHRVLDEALDEDNLSGDTDTVFERAVGSGAYGTGHLAFDRRGTLNDYGSVRARERERRELDDGDGDLPRRDPSSVTRLRDDERMDDDIAYHRMRNERERMQATRDRTLAMLERRQARSIMDREEWQRVQEASRHEANREATPYDTSLEERSVEAGSDPVIIPPLSSVRSEEDVRDVLSVHGITSVRARMRDRDNATEFTRSRPDTPRRQPSFSSTSTVSGTTASISTVAQAGSVISEDASTVSSGSNGADQTSLRVARASFSEGLDEYGMDVDAEGDNEHEGGDDSENSDATDIDCAEPSMLVQHDETSSTGPTSGGSGASTEVSVSSSTSPTLSADTAETSILTIPSFSAPGTHLNFASAHVADQSSSSSIPFPASSSSSISSSSPSSSTSNSPPASARPVAVSHSLPPCRDLIESTDRLDVAGVTFDPRGAYMYVATVDGITEWAMKGAEERWWSSGGFI